MDTKQPNALRLADALGRAPKWQQLQAAAEMRRLHAENEALRAGYDAARLEIKSLQARLQELGQMARECSDRKVVKLDARIKELEAQLDAVVAGGMEPLRKRECLHQIQEPDHFRGATKMVQVAAPVVLPAPVAYYDGERWYANEESAICACATSAQKGYAPK